MCTIVNTVDIMLDTTGPNVLSLEVRGERLELKLSPGMAAVLLAALQHYADDGYIDPQQYGGINLRFPGNTAYPTPTQTPATAHR